jgi:hypothetical protein
VPRNSRRALRSESSFGHKQSCLITLPDSRLRPTLGYLTRLRRRMEQLRLDDKLYHDLLRAQVAMQDLCGELHYRSCESGVGRAR